MTAACSAPLFDGIECQLAAGHEGNHQWDPFARPAGAEDKEIGS